MFPTHENPGEANNSDTNTEHEEDDEDGEDPTDERVIKTVTMVLHCHKNAETAHDQCDQSTCCYIYHSAPISNTNRFYLNHQDSMTLLH